MVESCCQLGDILVHEPERVLYETDNFFVAPTIGPIGIEGYLLILSKFCFSGMGALPESLYGELESVIETTKRVIKLEYGVAPHLFEHGPRICDVHGGGCLDHAHLHLIPGEDIMGDLGAEMMLGLDQVGMLFGAERTDNFKRAAEICHDQRHSYMIVESSYGQRVIINVNFHIPSQYLRRMVADKSNSAMWDWKKWPDHDTVKKTIKSLTGKF